MRSFFDTQPLSSAELPSLDDSFRALKAHVKSYRAALNDEGIWLFVSTLGCWSVGQPKFQLCAYAVAFAIFAQRMSDRSPEVRSFSALIAILESRVRQEAQTAEERTKQLLRLDNFRKDHVAGRRPFLSGSVFFLCWCFYGFSLMHTLLGLLPSQAM
jgi:hypothetical protein